MVDLATLGIELNTAGMARGEREAASIGAKIISHLDRIEQRARQMNKAVSQAFSFGGGSANGSASTAGRIRSNLDGLAVSQQKAADAALKHSQGLARLLQVQGNTAGAIGILRNALNNYNGSFTQIIRTQTQLTRLQNQQGFRRFASTVREAGESLQQTGYFLAGLSTSLIGVGAAAVKSAFDIDRNVNVLKALTGSADAAEKRFRALVELSRQTPGLTTGIATTIDAQLRVAGATEKAINRVLPAIGRLNAVSNLQDPQRFVQNLVQLITQDFERIDLKELIGQSPLAGELIKDVFKVDSPINSKAIRESARKLGITTIDSFFDALGKAAERNQKLAGITESLSTQFAKLTDRVTVALRPLGLAIIGALGPIVERAVIIIEKLSQAFSALSPGLKQAILLFGGLGIALGPAVIGIGAFVQAIGAIGNLSAVAAGLGGIKSVIAGLGISFPIAAAAIGAFALAYITDFGGIRDITKDAGRTIQNEMRNAQGALAGVKPALRDLSNAFHQFSDDAKPLIQDFWQLFKSEAEIAIRASIALTQQGVAAIKAILSNATLSNILSGGALGSLKNASEGARSGLKREFLGNILTGGTGAAINSIAGQLGSVQPPEAPGFKPPKSPIDLIREQEIALKAFRDQQKARGGTSSDKKSSAESAARQLRAAEEQLAAATAKAQFDIQEKLVRNIVDLEKDAFDKRLISANDYYDRLLKRELELQEIEKARIQSELVISQQRQRQSKAGSPEALREQAQQVDLQKQLQVLELERPNILRRINGELDKTLTTEKERNREAVAAAAQTNFNLNKQFIENFDAQQTARRDRPETNLRIEEIRLQGLANAGLIREQELTDALILTRRRYREELILAAEARKREILANTEDTGRFSAADRIDEEIASLQTLGTELTRAEALHRRFAEQGVLDYSRLNEGVEDYLASQKTLTESFRDFRTNQVADAFKLIEVGVDKLTEKFGLFGDAINQLLKDLLKLAATSIFRKLFGLESGGQQSPGLSLLGGGGGGGGSSLSLGNLIPGVVGGGGGGAGGGGGTGFGQFATGGFAGGNPVQQILGGGGQQSGGLTGLLRKIPGLKSIFGSGASSSGGAVASGPFAGANAGASAAGGVGLFGSLGATGLLAGGGLLGSLAGGNSQFGRLLGGVGGTLLGGAIGASGLLGGGIAGALPALFSNPITVIIGGALIGGALLARYFADREFNKFRKEVDKEYQLKVDKKEAGRGLYKSVKELGEQEFGKGKFGKKIVDTIRLQKAQEQLAAYGEATGQENNPLVRKFRDVKELTDPSDPRNQFVKRAYGGAVNARQPYIVGDGGRPEVFVPQSNGHIYPSIADFAREVVKAMAGQVAPSATDIGQGGGFTGEIREMLRMVLGQNVRLAAALERFESMPPEHVVMTGARRAPDAVTEAVATSFSRRTPASDQIRDGVVSR